MKTLIDLNNNNFYTRHISVFHVPMLVLFIIMILFFNTIIQTELSLNNVIWGIIYFIALFFNFYQFRYYIIRIILNEKKAKIIYYSWLRLKLVELERNEISIKHKMIYAHYYKIVIYASNKKILTQYSKYKLSLSEWTEDKLKYTYDELNRFINQIQIEN